MSILGTRVVRTEDPKLLTAGGTYVEDLRLPELIGAARVTFVRSPMAHAEITGVDGAGHWPCPARSPCSPPRTWTTCRRPRRPAKPGSEGAPLPMGGPYAEPLLAVGRVRYVGEPVAMVLTDDSYQGEDAAELVSVDYAPLPPVVGLRRGALADRALLFPGAGLECGRARWARPPTTARSTAARWWSARTIVNQRLAPVPMEGRAAAAQWADGKLTVWASTQNAQISRFILAGALGLDPGAIRVVTPDVGGGFGAKVGVDRDVLRSPGRPGAPGGRCAGSRPAARTWSG